MGKTVIQVSTPCHESWAAMTPASAGRHCAACQQVVVDFTQQTDAELLAYLARAGSQPCGRFRAGQLGRLLQPAASASRWRSWLASLLALGSLGLVAFKAKAQAPASLPSGAPALVSTDVSSTGRAVATMSAAAGGQLTDTTAVVYGLVCDAKCEPLPGVRVLVKNTLRGTSTSAQGEFQLALEPGEQSVQLVFSFVGYVTQEHSITIRPGSPVQLEIPLEEEVMGLADISYRPPWPWHPRRFYYWGKYWLTRPFRQ